MNFISCFETSPVLLMEGALGERLKREYNLLSDENVGLADIIYRDGGKEALHTLWTQYLDIAVKYNLPFLAATPTRRANKERVFKAGYDEDIVFDNVSFLKKLKNTTAAEMFIGGLMGCKGDAYKATGILQSDEAQEFHFWQADLFRQAGVDYLYAGIMPAVSEAIGMAGAMEQTALPYIISLMILENGKLPDGTTIHDAILQIDQCVGRKPICYMTNCVHPDILYKALCYDFNQTSLVRQRFHGIQANTSALPPEKLDNSIELKYSDDKELGQSIRRLAGIISLKIVGGCCGTDNSHINQIARIMCSVNDIIL